MENVNVLFRTYRTIFASVMGGIVGLIFLLNLAPLGISTSYNSDVDKETLTLGPSYRIDRVQEQGEYVYRQRDDLVYFSTPMTHHFDYATVKVVFKNPYPDQEIHLGFKDQEEWHYDTKVIDAPFLNGKEWRYITGKGPYLFQKNPMYKTVEEFLTRLPKKAIIGVYQRDPDLLAGETAPLSGYAPTSSETVMDTPLRGKHTMYAYVKDEPFQITFEKQDLNWYADPDVVVIKVYKEGERVFTGTIDDDGIKSNSKRVLPAQQLTIQNPGPGLPEPGVYKIVIDASQDTIIKRISTNLHKVVFEGPIFPVENASVYPALIDETRPTSLFTNTFMITAKTYHKSALQDLTVGKEKLSLSHLNMEQALASQSEQYFVTAPKSDVIINGVFGYFAFAESQFFEPSPYFIFPITSSTDTALTEFVFTDYTPSRESADGWKVAEKKFNLYNAVIKDDKLNWLIKVPRLKENNQEILIKKIEVRLYKESWF